MNRDDIIRMAIKCQLVTTGNRDGLYMDALGQFAALVAAAEREACARVCESHAAEWRHLGGLVGSTSEDIAVRIRARGNET